MFNYKLKKAEIVDCFCFFLYFYDIIFVSMEVSDMIITQQKMLMSKYAELYNIVVPKDNILRQIKELINFDFVFDELKNKYSDYNGRPAHDPIMMFKYLLIKYIENISDVDLVNRTRYDMSFKYFLDLAPEDTDLIDPSSLTKFRRQRLKDVELLDLLIGKTVRIAIEKKIIKPKSKIIVDSTHTYSRYNLLSPRQALINESKELRKRVYDIDASMRDKMPKKREASGILEDEIQYCKELIDLIENEEAIKQYPKVSQKLNLLKEMVEDNNYHLAQSKDTDARVGHKTADTNFFGYKTHVAMTPERIITAVKVTSGEKHDGKQLEDLINKSESAGIQVTAVIGDAAYSEKENLKMLQKRKIKLFSKLNSRITHVNKLHEDSFEYNKDAGMYVCKAGHMAIKKSIAHHSKGIRQNDREVYYFDTEKCKICPYKKGCYTEGAKNKTYTVTIKSPEHLKQEKFQNSKNFLKHYKERYKIEAKNAELKQNFGYNYCKTEGLSGMDLQAAMTIFAVNIKRILKLSTV